MSFVKDGKDFLNVNTVPRVRPIPNGTGGTPRRMFVDRAKNDGAVPISEALLGDLEAMTSPVVASSGQVSVAVIIRAEPMDHRPTADDVRVKCMAIADWRIGRSGAEPVYLGTEPSGELFLGLAGGKLLEVATGRLHDGVDGAKQVVLRSAQTVWDSEHPGEPELNPAIVEQRVEPIKLVGGRRHAR